MSGCVDAHLWTEADVEPSGDCEHCWEADEASRGKEEAHSSAFK
jgi:hypothetical protein